MESGGKNLGVEMGGGKGAKPVEEKANQIQTGMSCLLTRELWGSDKNSSARQERQKPKHADRTRPLRLVRLQHGGYGFPGLNRILGTSLWHHN